MSRAAGTAASPSPGPSAAPATTESCGRAEAQEAVARLPGSDAGDWPWPHGR